MQQSADQIYELVDGEQVLVDRVQGAKDDSFGGKAQ